MPRIRGLDWRIDAEYDPMSEQEAAHVDQLDETNSGYEIAVEGFDTE